MNAEVDGRIHDLVLALERMPDGDAKATAQELMRTVLDLHGEALARVLELVGPDALRTIAADQELRPVLEMHGLVPPPPPAPVESAPVAFVRKEPRERCELCGTPADEDHPHVVDITTGGLGCACRPCHLLLSSSGAGGDRWRAVPDVWRAVDAVDLPDVPVGVAFLVVESRRGRPVAYYPGPAGATESELDLDAADLPDLEPDVQALVVRDGEAYVVPVSAAFGLVGDLRQQWEGLTGGDAPTRVLDQFLLGARRRAAQFEGRPA